jgi:hypothetical protein
VRPIRGRAAQVDRLLEAQPHLGGAFCNGKKLELNIDLLREVDHPRNLAVIPHTERVLTHRMRVTEADQLDDSIADMLRESYAEVGPGTRTKPA